MSERDKDVIYIQGMRERWEGEPPEFEIKLDGLSGEDREKAILDYLTYGFYLILFSDKGAKYIAPGNVFTDVQDAFKDIRGLAKTKKFLNTHPGDSHE